MPPTIRSKIFGHLDEQAAQLFELSNSQGVRTEITNYGGTVVSLHVPDRQGKLSDVVLGYPTLQQYITGGAYFGCIVGRYGNRIANGCFVVDDIRYELARNNETNHLHGGIRGFDKYVWEAREASDENAARLVLSHTSPDGDEGYPGNLSVTCVYELTEDSELCIRYVATTDKATPLNLTHHSYFNLGGHDSGDVLGHSLQIFAEYFTPIDENLVPTGELRSVAGTALDFRQPTPIGARIDDADEQIRLGGGYDHNYVLDDSARTIDGTLASVVIDPKSGRKMEVLTSEPGVQFYSANWVNDQGKAAYGGRSAFCLETQHFPDSPNRAEFPSTILLPGQTFRSTTIYRFGIA